MIPGIVLVIISLIALPYLIVSNKNPLLKWHFLLMPLLGILGIGFCFWGLYGIFSLVIFEFNRMVSAPINWLTIFLVNLFLVWIGFLMGYAMISQYIFFKDEEIRTRGKYMLTQLTIFQSKVSLGGFIVGIWTIFSSNF